MGNARSLVTSLYGSQESMENLFTRMELAWVMPRRLVRFQASWKHLQGNPQVAEIWIFFFFFLDN